MAFGFFSSQYDDQGTMDDGNLLEINDSTSHTKH